MINYTLQTEKLIITDDSQPNMIMEIRRRGKTDTELKEQGQIDLADHTRQKKNWDQVLGSPVRDDTYMNGSLARSDYTITTSEGQAIKNKLLTDWPNEVEDYQNSDINLVAEYTAQRDPYVNDSISWYSFDNDRPPSAVRSAYGLTDATESYREWYGLKFDKITKEVLCKAVYTFDGFMTNKRNDMQIPTLPKWIYDSTKGNNEQPSYVAMIHDKTKNIDEHYDIYFAAPESLVKEWCTENSLVFSHDADIKDDIMLWGITIKGTTGEIKYVKAYTRYFL